MKEIINKIDSIFENMEEYSDRVQAQDPFLKKVYEFQLMGAEFCEIQPFKNYAICTAKDDVQHKTNPIPYYTVIMDDKKFKYFRLNHRNAEWSGNDAVEITEEDFMKSILPAETNPGSDLRDKESNYTTKDKENNPVIKDAEPFELRKKNYPDVDAK